MALDLPQWIELCRGTDVDDEIVGSMWGASQITPPPVAHPPITRYALTRAEQLASAGETAGTGAEETSRLRGLAIEWLSHPHPRASAQVRQEMKRLKAELEALLAGSPWCTDEFSIADIAWACSLQRARLRLDILTTPKIQAWADAILERESFVRAWGR